MDKAVEAFVTYVKEHGGDCDGAPIGNTWKNLESLGLLPEDWRLKGQITIKAGVTRVGDRYVFRKMVNEKQQKRADKQRNTEHQRSPVTLDLGNGGEVTAKGEQFEAKFTGVKKVTVEFKQ